MSVIEMAYGNGKLIPFDIICNTCCVLVFYRSISWTIPVPGLRPTVGGTNRMDQMDMRTDGQTESDRMETWAGPSDSVQMEMIKETQERISTCHR